MFGIQRITDYFIGKPVVNKPVQKRFSDSFIFRGFVAGKALIDLEGYSFRFADNEEVFNYVSDLISKGQTVTLQHKSPLGIEQKIPKLEISFDKVNNEVVILLKRGLIECAELLTASLIGFLNKGCKVAVSWSLEEKEDISIIDGEDELNEQFNQGIDADLKETYESDEKEVQLPEDHIDCDILESVQLATGVYPHKVEIRKERFGFLWLKSITRPFILFNPD